MDHVPIQIHADTRFTQEERWIAEYARRDLVKFTRDRAELGIVWDLDETTLLALKDEPHMLRLLSSDPRVTAVDAELRGRGRARGFQKGPGVVRDYRHPMMIGIVVDRVPELYPVVLHELGHAVGMDELPPGRAGVMCSPNPAWKFTDADREECRRVGLCDW